MNRYFLVSIDVSAGLMNGGFPDISWFIYGEHRVQDLHLRGHRSRAGVVYVRDGNGCVGVVGLDPLIEGSFIVFGNNEDKVQLVVLGVLRGVDGGVDLGYLELPVELEGLDEMRRGVGLVEVLHVKVEAHVVLVHENRAEHEYQDVSGTQS